MSVSQYPYNNLYKIRRAHIVAHPGLVSEMLGMPGIPVLKAMFTNRFAEPAMFQLTISVVWTSDF